MIGKNVIIKDTPKSKGVSCHVEDRVSLPLTTEENKMIVADYYVVSLPNGKIQIESPAKLHSLEESKDDKLNKEIKKLKEEQEAVYSLLQFMQSKNVSIKKWINNHNLSKTTDLPIAINDDGKIVINKF